MKTLIEHVESLSRYCNDSPEIILWSILRHDKIIDDDSLLVYCVEDYPSGRELNVMWGDGNGKKLNKWAERVAKENDCVKMYVITKRWRPFARMFHCRPVGVILEREVK